MDTLSEKMDSILVVLNDIKELLKEQSNQSQTKITVIGSKPKTTPNGLKSDEDFSL
jgi:hypothetical protein